MAVIFTPTSLLNQQFQLSSTPSTSTNNYTLSYTTTSSTYVLSAQESTVQVIQGTSICLINVAIKCFRIIVNLFVCT
jgi:hypothetical protein